MKQSTEQTYLGRGLHSDKWKDALEGKGKLKELIEEVRKDKDLVLQIRENYFNVYYKGGNLVKVKSENSFLFDCNYYKYNLEFDTDEKRKGEHKKVLETLKKARDYKVFIVEMKKIMDGYWRWLETEKHRSLHEKDTQHALCLSNTESNDYTIIDLEFQVSSICSYHYEKPSRPSGRYVDEKKSSPRFDIVAVRNRDHRLCLIELKSGVNALYGKSGIGDHADSFEGSIGRNAQTSKAFLKEMLKVVSDKKELKILNDGFYVSDENPEFIYAYAFKSEDKAGKERERNAFEKERNEARCGDYKVIYLNKGVFTLKDDKC